MVASTVKNGNDRLRKGNQTTRLSLFCVSHEQQKGQLIKRDHGIIRYKIFIYKCPDRRRCAGCVMETRG